MQLNRGQIEFEQPHILHDQGVGAGFPVLPDKPARGFQFVVAQNRIERDQNAGIEAVRMPGQTFDVRQRIAGVGARTEGWTTDIDGVRAVLDGGDAEIGIFGGREKFDFVVSGGHRQFFRQYGVYCNSLIINILGGVFARYPENLVNFVNREKPVALIGAWRCLLGMLITAVTYRNRKGVTEWAV